MGKIFLTLLVVSLLVDKWATYGGKLVFVLLLMLQCLKHVKSNVNHTVKTEDVKHYMWMSRKNTYLQGKCYLARVHLLANVIKSIKFHLTLILKSSSEIWYLNLVRYPQAVEVLWSDIYMCPLVMNATEILNRKILYSEIFCYSI